MADSIAAPAGTSAQQPRLAAGALGLAGQLFQSITHMAPAAGVIFSAQYMASKGGGSLTLAWILACVACLLTALCLKEVVRKVRSAGGYFVIHSVALGHFVGFTTSWLWFLFEPLVPAALAMLFGSVLSDFINTYTGILIPWWLIAVVMIGILTYTSYVGIRQSSRTTVILGSLEITILTVLGIIWIVQAGPNQPVISLTPASSPLAWGGVFFATVYGILSFLGFEAGVPLAEESNNARRSLVISILASTIGIGFFYCFLGYATVAGWGFQGPQQFADDFSNAVNPYFTLGQNALGFFGVLLVLFAIGNSSFACSVAGQNASTRVYYSLGRAGVFPSWLNHINAKTQTPDRAIFLQAALSLVFALLVGFLFGPFIGYGLLGLLFTIALMIVYTMTNVSCFALYYFKFRPEFSVFWHLVIPILGTIAMLLPLAAALIPDVIFGPENANVYPLTLGLPITVVWFVLGLGLYLWLRAQRPKELDVMANEMATVELVGEENDPMSRAVAAAPRVYGE
ncbi:MAG: APC family permease, partial [Chloroflexi bacterium]|nr:APC family permease [Chloroflexota bacterium]